MHKQAVREQAQAKNAERTEYAMREPNPKELAELQSLFREMKFQKAMEKPRQANESDGYLVSVEGKSGRIMGGLLYRISGERRNIEITIVAVPKEFREKGIGSALVEKALELGREKGCKSASLSLVDEPLEPFYKKLGFRPIQAEDLELKMSMRL